MDFRWTANMDKNDLKCANKRHICELTAKFSQYIFALYVNYFGIVQSRFLAVVAFDVLLPHLDYNILHTLIVRNTVQKVKRLVRILSQILF